MHETVHARSDNNNVRPRIARHMTDEVFQKVFDEVFASIPSYAKDAITSYVGRFVQSEILVSDDCANQAQKTKDIPVPASLLLATDTHWHFVFRPHVLTAPIEILKTIIRHEIVHGFLISVERIQSDTAQKAVDDYKAQVEKVCRLAGIPVPPSYEEDLVCIINDDWGGDEIKAKEWVRLNNKP